MSYRGAALGWLLLAGAVCAGEADVVDARLIPAGAGVYRIDVTVRHADSGWDHYADRWQVLDGNGNVLGTRTLLHPHVDEQPFTRSLSGLRIAPGVTEIEVRARDSVHGEGGRVLRLDVPR